MLVREGFSWAALILGPVWLLANRAWIPAALTLAAEVAAARTWPLGLAVAVGIGLFGRDLVRWSLARRGFALVHVVAGRDQDEALARCSSAVPT